MTGAGPAGGGSGDRGGGDRGGGDGDGAEAAGPVARAAAALGDRLSAELGDAFSPRLGLVLGSGLGGLASRFDGEVRVQASRLPGWPRSTVSGHAGEVVAGELGGMPAVGLSGRVHLYEGHPPARVALPVRVMAELGIRALFVSNAAGTIRPSFRPGELMLIADHLNLQWANPLVGPVRRGEERFPDMSLPYDPGLRAAVRRTAREEGIRLHEGVYAGLLGPSYETPAEIDMVERLGADAVGMSTVPEVVAARARGIRCFGVSCLTNRAAGRGGERLTHREVLETTERTAATFRRLVLGTVERLVREGALDGP